MARQRITHGLLFAAITLAACSWTATSFAAQADSTPPPPSATLQVSGGVMVSQGQQAFQTVASGQPVVAGERLMVTQGGSATVVYGNNCTQTFSQPGVYVVPASCTPAPIPVADTQPASTGGGGGGLATLAVVGGIAAVTLLNPNRGGSNNAPPSPPPISH